MKLFRSKIIIFFLLIMFNSTAFAFLTTPTPTITGSTGLVRMPTADVLPYKNVNFGLDIGQNMITNNSAFYYKMNLGTFQGLEIGFVGMDNTQGMAREGVFINMKYGLSTDSSPYPLLLAIGVENLSSFNNTDVYMVATKYFPDGPKFHFGFMGDFVDRFRPLGMFGFEMSVFYEDLYMQNDVMIGETVFEWNLGFKWYASENVTWNLSFVNLTATQDTPVTNYKDPKALLVGFSWINPL
ncbi:hypothetical protein ACFLZ2_03515 [Candidatus Margulisiibacteriota bacterium]